MIRTPRSWWLAPCVFLLAGAGDGPPQDPVAARLARGRAAFEQLWSVAPSAFGRWGRGPLSNGETCADCHADHGRGALPDADEPLRAAVLKLSIVGTDADGAPRPDPVYGSQLQHLGILGRVPPEGEAYVIWGAHTHRYPDGTALELRSPRIRLEHLAHGPIADDTQRSLRVPPALHGVGRLEAIPEALLREHAAHAQPDGVKGRLNRVPDGTGAWRVGRFGHKAVTPDLREQTLTAFHEDLGVTSTRFPAPNCTPAQSACQAELVPADPEVSDAMVDDLLFDLRRVPPPGGIGTTDAAAHRGQHLFGAAGCGVCHVPTWPVIDADGIPRTIAPYTDLLLHDLGPALADGRVEFAAGPADWRTAPLWSTGRGGPWLHDGRARSPEEAILWHDGEAATARMRFESLDRADRTALLRFLDSLR